jgi:hypothetical protein
MLSFFEDYSKNLQLLSYLKLRKWLLEVFNEGKSPKILENLKNIRLSDRAVFKETILGKMVFFRRHLQKIGF